MNPFAFLLLPLCLAAASADAIEVDGRIDPAEWQGARHITDFVLVQPMTGSPATLRTEAWILATPQGLAVAFRNQQPPEVPRSMQRTRRDQGGQLDRVNFMVDFDGDGRTGYDFMVTVAGGISDEVITSERNFNTDWDGHWHHAVSQDEQAWSVEMLIPWHVAPMARPADGKRTLGVYFDRVVGSTGERFGWPDISFQNPRFLSEFTRIEVPLYEQALLAVTPYAVAVEDIAQGATSFDAGADVFWKPNGQFQLSGTLNPDFGQVESDDLVVNFGAVETFFGDKRPFFTENQGLFDLPFGAGNSRLLYTRRIGGTTDDRQGAGDVQAAIKLNGSLGQVRYGLLAAAEADEVGRDFFALRATRDFGVQDLGGMVTRVDSPFRDRRATVYAVDHLWTPGAAWNIRSVLVASSVEQAGERTDDSGLQLRVDQALGNGWRQQAWFLHSGDQLQLNDIGFLDRNNFNYLRYELARRRSDPPSGSAYASHDWRGAASLRRNDQGLRITEAVALQRFSERRDGGNEFFDVAVFTPGNDDLITRGNGAVAVPAKLSMFWERSRPQRGRWSWYGSLRSAGEGLDGPDALSLDVFLQPTLHLSDSLLVQAGVGVQHNPDWLLWRGADRLASYRADQLRLSGSLQWQIGSRQELRVKLETIALDASLRQAWVVGAGGEPVGVATPTGTSDFSLANLGFQVRYRYELAPLSDLYVVYGRGGLDNEDSNRSLADLLGDASSLDDSQQILVKLSYRFAN
ncbi:MAG: hypothetical protein K0M70_15960 [Arenimonas sp.]|uniref:DUF5916 domain-containing protein n=1 Tax=Arenimonas sp. TaxID=1872635 RepID=UPI0025C5B8EA|nr:DUF5916 domain-containing protein [Arenimonas sp.]MBW8369334.1 hypothetical protein [Arenimonas sp.]